MRGRPTYLRIVSSMSPQRYWNAGASGIHPGVRENEHHRANDGRTASSPTTGKGKLRGPRMRTILRPAHLPLTLSTNARPVGVVVRTVQRRSRRVPNILRVEPLGNGYAWLPEQSRVPWAGLPLRTDPERCRDR